MLFRSVSQSRYNPSGSSTDLYFWNKFWGLVPGNPVRTSGSIFTITGDYSSFVAKSMVVKWTENSVVKMGMISIPSVYSNPNTTVTFIGDTMSSIDINSLKYGLAKPQIINFSYAGKKTIGLCSCRIRFSKLL